jgi:hypothetical protein
MKNIAPTLASFLALFLVSSLNAASAADTVFPPGVRIGLTPLVGLAPAKSFTGFETSDQGVKVLMTELPAAAYTEVDNSFKPGAASPPGPVKPETLETTAGKAFYTIENGKDPSGANVRRYSMILPGGTFSGYIAVQVPENAMRIYSDDAVRQMFTSAAIRKEVPVEEQLALMPFRVTEMSGFTTVRTLAPGAALLLADSSDEAGIETKPFMILGTIGSAPERPEDRDRFAQQAATQIPGLRDARITMSEPVRLDSTPGWETRIDATSGKDNTPVTVVQWLRFGGGPLAVRIIASTPRSDFAQAFPRFRAVRDGVQPK